MLLEGKNAVIYGAGGGIGGAVAQVFAREGARLFLVGRTLAKLEKVAASIRAAGGQAETAEFDVLDEQAVDEHARRVCEQAGSLDISFNLISRGDAQGVPLIEMTTADLARAVQNGLIAQFITARAAARCMAARGSGVILMLTSASSGGAVPMMGSTPAADAASEAFMRCLAAELGPSGIRVLRLWTAAVRETLTPESINAVNHEMQMDAAGVERLLEQIGAMTMLRRAPELAQIAETAAFLASDKAGAITGSVVNLTCGMVAN